jgi:hypothetical protein
MTRPLICTLLLAISGFARIALAGDAADIRKTHHELEAALKRAVVEIVQKGERDPKTIASFAMGRTQSERREFIEVRVNDGVRRGLTRSGAEANANAEIQEMLDDLVEITLSQVKDGIPLPPK